MELKGIEDTFLQEILRGIAGLSECGSDHKRRVSRTKWKGGLPWFGGDSLSCWKPPRKFRKWFEWEVEGGLKRATVGWGSYGINLVKVQELNVNKCQDLKSVSTATQLRIKAIILLCIHMLPSARFVTWSTTRRFLDWKRIECSKKSLTLPLSPLPILREKGKH